MDNVLWVPTEARWQTLQDNTKQPTIGKLIDEMLAPYTGRIYDLCCGSDGIFAQSEKFVEEHGRRIGNISVYGQEFNSTTRRLAMMNLAICGIEGELGPERADTFRGDLHKDLMADWGGDSARRSV